MLEDFLEAGRVMRRQLRVDAGQYASRGRQHRRRLAGRAQQHDHVGAGGGARVGRHVEPPLDLAVGTLSPIGNDADDLEVFPLPPLNSMSDRRPAGKVLTGERLADDDLRGDGRPVTVAELAALDHRECGAS